MILYNDKDLVQLYFRKDRDILIIGSRTWDGPYKTCGFPTIVPYTTSNEILGKLIVVHFSRVDSFTSKDENANFFKELKGMSSWRKFAQAVGLICVWKTHHEYEMIYNVRNSDNSFSPDGKHCSHLSICSSEELIGAKAKELMGLQQEDTKSM